MVRPEKNRSRIWLNRLQPYAQRLTEAPDLVVEGRLSRMVGLTLEAVGCKTAIGSRCRIEMKTEEKSKPKWSVFRVTGFF